MKHISESIIGRKGVGLFQSIIIVPVGLDYTVCSRSLYYATSFKFGENNIWTGFATGWENAEDIFRNIVWPQTKIFVSSMPIDSFIREFTRTNKHSRSIVAVNAPKSHHINTPKNSKQITLDELRDIVKKCELPSR